MLTFSVHLVIEFKAKHFATKYPRENKIFSKTALFTVGSGSILSQKRGIKYRDTVHNYQNKKILLY